MALPDTRRLDGLLRVLRKHGVTRFSDGTMELSIGGPAAETPNSEPLARPTLPEPKTEEERKRAALAQYADDLLRGPVL